MEITKEFKKLYLEFFSRAAIVIFTVGLATPFVAGGLTLPLALIALFSIIICLSIASLFSLTIKEEEEND